MKEQNRPERVLGLFKLGSRAHMEDLRDGHVYMLPLSAFVRMEADELRADRDEGLTYTMPPDGARLSMKRPGAQAGGDDWQNVGTLTGPLRSFHEDNRRVNVFCMHAFLEGRTFVDPRNLRFGDTYVVFTEGDEFLRRAREEADRLNLKLEARTVEYVNESTYRGPMGPFRKYSPFAYQSEARLALRPGTGEACSLRIGDLSDITMIGPTADLNNRIRVTYNRA
jgi:hypothetical protein